MVDTRIKCPNTWHASAPARARLRCPECDGPIVETVVIIECGNHGHASVTERDVCRDIAEHAVYAHALDVAYLGRPCICGGDHDTIESALSCLTGEGQ